jgi:hypothetical protein
MCRAGGIIDIIGNVSGFLIAFLAGAMGKAGIAVNMGNAGAITEATYEAMDGLESFPEQWIK